MTVTCSGSCSETVVGVGVSGDETSFVSGRDRDFVFDFLPPKQDLKRVERPMLSDRYALRYARMEAEEVVAELNNEVLIQLFLYTKQCLPCGFPRHLDHGPTN